MGAKFKILPPPEEHQTWVDKLGDRLSETGKFMVVGVILMFFPLSVYNGTKNSMGYEMATHLGFLTGVVCMLMASYLLFFSGWFMDLDD